MLKLTPGKSVPWYSWMDGKKIQSNGTAKKGVDVVKKGKKKVLNLYVLGSFFLFPLQISVLACICKKYKNNLFEV